MTKKPAKSVTKKQTNKKLVVKAVGKKTIKQPKNKIWAKWLSFKLWQKTVIVVVFISILLVGQAYAIAYWYQHQHRSEKLTYGVTFISNYAKYLDLDPHETFLALRDDLGFKRFRLVSYWDEIEKTPGQYDFTDLDWQFDRVAEKNGTVTLAMGLRQPRWPECHASSWVVDQSADKWYPELEKYMVAVAEHYKNRPELQSYQLENEFFLGVFGDCQRYGADRQRLVGEFDLLKKTDPNHPIILSYANNHFGVATGKPQPDQIGVSVYKRVWDKTVTKRYFEYPFTSWYYAWRAGIQQILTGKTSMLHELQAEPWPPAGIKDASVSEQNKSMDAKRLKERINYGEATGFRDIDLWGGEWWYWRKVKFNDPSLWNTVKNTIPPKNL